MKSLLNYLLTYLLTLRSSVFLDKITDSKLVTEFTTFYGTLRVTSITAFTSARHLSLYRSKSIQSMPVIQLPEDLSSKWPISLMFPYQKPLCTSTLPATCYMPRSCHAFRFDN
jgi:hypothetical protein